MDWLNEPPRWRREGGVLHVATGERTDFWREPIVDWPLRALARRGAAR